jgi:ABC-type antimicrobial peptide transport system permease subunit
VFSQAIKALKANRLKTTLIYFSLIFSIVAIFLITSISNGIISMYSNMIKTDGDIIVTQAKISDTFFSNVDVTLIKKIEKVEGVNSATAMIVGASPVEEIPIVAVYGVTNNRFKNYKLTTGSYPKQGEVIVGKPIYDQLEDKNSIAIADMSFSVSGVYESDIGFENGGVVLTIKDAGKIFNKSASMLLVTAKLDHKVEPIVENIKKLSNKIDVKSTDNFVKNYNQFKIIKTSSYVISFIAFAMGLLGIVSIMSITINQRKSEFGILKAIGISTKKVVGTIMIESFIIGVLAFISAFFISNVILYLIKNSEQLQGYVNGEISTSLALFVFIASMSMTIIGAIIPAFKAGKTDPIILIQGNNS